MKHIENLRWGIAIVALAAAFLALLPSALLSASSASTNSNLQLSFQSYGSGTLLSSPLVNQTTRLAKPVIASTTTSVQVVQNNTKHWIITFNPSILTPLAVSTADAVYTSEGCTITHNLQAAISVVCPANVTIPGAVPDQIINVTDLNTDNQINATIVWPNFTGTGVTIAVLDTGIDYNQPQLVHGIAGGDCFAIAAGDCGNGYYDDYGHGTNVAGIIMSAGLSEPYNGSFSKGVAPTANVWMGKVCNGYGQCYTSDIMAGIQYVVDNHISKVISMSLGGPSSIGANCDSDPLAQQVNWAYGQGVVTVAAAGNGGTPIVDSPGCASNAIAVSALCTKISSTGVFPYSIYCPTEKINTIATFSSYGQGMISHGVAAPGVEVYATVPTGSCSLCNYTGYEYLSGTSEATPHVSGMIALMLQKDPNLNASTIRQIVFQSADCLNNEYGTCPNIYIGEGLINASRAVAFAGTKFTISTSTTTIAPTFSISAKISNSVAVSGQTENLSETVTGGAPPYTIKFYNDTKGADAYDIGYQGFVPTNSYPEATDFPTCTYLNNYVYCISDNSTAIPQAAVYENNHVYYAPVLSNGNIGQWTFSQDYPIGGKYLGMAEGCAGSGNYIYCVGGGIVSVFEYDNIVTSYAYSAKTLQNGALSDWAQTSSYPIGIGGQSCVATSTHIYCVAGTTGTVISGTCPTECTIEETFSNAAYYATISNGQIGTWTAAPSYPFAGFGTTCVLAENNSSIYCTGGQDIYSGGENYDSVYYAKILSNGGLGNWTYAGQGPSSNIVLANCVSQSNTIYCTGAGAGSQVLNLSSSLFGIVGTPSNLSYYTQILNNGSISSWTKTSPFPFKLWGPGCVAARSNMYCIGGWYNIGNFTNGTYYSTINKNGLGTSSSWTFTANAQGTQTFTYNTSTTDSERPTTKNLKSPPLLITVNGAGSSTTTTSVPTTVSTVTTSTSTSLPSTISTSVSSTTIASTTSKSTTSTLSTSTSVSTSVSTSTTSASTTTISQSPLVVSIAFGSDSGTYLYFEVSWNNVGTPPYYATIYESSTPSCSSSSTPSLRFEQKSGDSIYVPVPAPGIGVYYCAVVVDSSSPQLSALTNAVYVGPNGQTTTSITSTSTIRTTVSTSVSTSTSTSVSTTTTITPISYTSGENANSQSLTLASGYSSYICNGANFNSDFTGSWTPDSGTAYVHMGRQTSNICSSSQSSSQSLGAIGLNNAVLAQSVQKFNTTSSSFSYNYNVNSNGQFVVISIACGYYQCTSITVPVGCTTVVSENVGVAKEGTSYMAICSSQNTGTYTVSGNLLASGNVAGAVYAFT